MFRHIYIRKLIFFVVLIGAMSVLCSCIFGKTNQTYNFKRQQKTSDTLDELRQQAFALLQIGKWNEAIEIFAKILQSEPKDPLTLYGNALALFNLQKVDDANANLDTAIEVLEKSQTNNALLADSLVLSAVISAVKKDNSDAIIKLQRAVKIIPNHFDANFSLGRAYFGNNDLINSLISFRRAVEIQPQNIRANFFLATTAERAGNYDEALKTYQEILRFYPNSFDGNLGLGVLLIKTEGNKSENGLKALQKAIEINPREYESRVALGKVLIGINRFPEAIENLQKAGELQPENPESYYQLAIAFKKNGQKAEAEAVLQKVKSIHSNRRNLNVKN
jgi:tetratricopeptide (TPR) repeat protein